MKLKFLLLGILNGCLYFLALPVLILLIGTFGIAILTPIAQIGLFLRFGEWYEADGFLVLGVWRLLQFGIPVNLENALQMRNHFATMNFGWDWKGMEIIAKWFLDIHLTISLIISLVILGLIVLFIWGSIYLTLEEKGILKKIEVFFKK